MTARLDISQLVATVLAMFLNGTRVSVAVLKTQPWQIVCRTEPPISTADVLQREATVFAVDDRKGGGTVPSEFRLYVEKDGYPGVADPDGTMHFFYIADHDKQQYLSSIQEVSR